MRPVRDTNRSVPQSCDHRPRPSSCRATSRHILGVHPIIPTTPRLGRPSMPRRRSTSVSFINLFIFILIRFHIGHGRLALHIHIHLQIQMLSQIHNLFLLITIHSPRSHQCSICSTSPLLLTVCWIAMICPLLIVIVLVYHLDERRAEHADCSKP